MPTPTRPNHALLARLAGRSLHASTSPLRLLALAALTAACVVWLTACGGGGGGGGKAGGTGDNLGSTGSTSIEAFPIGIAMGSPVQLRPGSEVVSGAMGVTDLGLGTAMVMEQAVLSSQADAVATGRLSVSGLLSANTLFDTSGRTHASCYGPAVAYLNHDDATGTDGTLGADQVAIWADTDNGSTPLACAAADINSQLASLAPQTHQAVLLMAGLRQLIVADDTLNMPAAGTSADLRTPVATWLSPVLSGVTVQAASVAVNADGSEYHYRLVLTRGGGASAQSIEINLLHTPAETDTRYAGVLQITLGYLSTDASTGCSDQRDSALRYKVARLITLGYNRHDEWLSQRLRAGQYCGNPTIGGSHHMAELAELALTGELEPATYLTGSTRGSTLGWRHGFVRMSQDMQLSEQSGDFIYAWQEQPLAGVGHARLYAGHSALNTSTGARTMGLFHGHTDDISTTDGTLLGLICNTDGPGSTSTAVDAAQYQALALGSSASNWSLSDSRIAYAPTNTCSASGTMSFDADGNTSVTVGEGSNTTPELLSPSLSGDNIQDEMLLRGFFAPTFLP